MNERMMASPLNESFKAVVCFFFSRHTEISAPLCIVISGRLLKFCIALLEQIVKGFGPKPPQTKENWKEMENMLCSRQEIIPIFHIHLSKCFMQIKLLLHYNGPNGKVFYGNAYFSEISCRPKFGVISMRCHPLFVLFHYSRPFQARLELFGLFRNKLLISKWY